MSTFQNLNPADDTASMKKIVVCLHCGEPASNKNKYCKDCGKAAYRHEIDAENEKILGYPIVRNRDGRWIKA